MERGGRRGAPTARAGCTVGMDTATLAPNGGWRRYLSQVPALPRGATCRGLQQHGEQHTTPDQTGALKTHNAAAFRIQPRRSIWSESLRLASFTLGTALWPSPDRRRARIPPPFHVTPKKLSSDLDRESGYPYPHATVFRATYHMLCVPCARGAVPASCLCTPCRPPLGFPFFLGC